MPSEQEVHLVSAATGGHLMGVTAQQCVELAQAGVLGAAYTVRADGAETSRRFYSEERIRELAAAEHLDKGAVQRIAGAHGYDRIVVIRQVASIPVEDPETDRREWYGIDYRAIHSGDPGRVAMQEEATRRWWGISHSNIVAFTRMQQAGRRAMLISTISGYAVFCRDITGLDLSMEVPSGHLAYAVEPPGHWAEEVLGRWVDSGRGRAMLTWEPLPH